MKGRWVVVLGVVCLAFSASGKMRVFTDSQGRSIEAEVVQFNTARSEVSIKRAGQRQAINVPITIFSKEDQSYIREWGRGQSILDKRLKADISRIKKRDADSSYGTSASTQVYTDHHFNIEFDNGTTTPLEDLDLEYVVFYEQERHISNGRKVELLEGRLYKKEKISLPARKVTEFDTKKVKLYTWVTYNLAPVDAEIIGVRVRLTLTSESGVKTMREFIYPKSLDLAWSTESVDSTRKIN